jgi:non-ribosomal peptide synthetase component F/acyl carrier protein
MNCGWNSGLIESAERTFLDGRLNVEPVEGGVLHQDGAGEPRQHGVLIRFPWQDDIWRGVESIAKAESLTPVSIALTAFAILLERLAGAPAPIWTQPWERRLSPDIAPIAEDTPLARFFSSVTTAGSFILASRATMNWYETAIASGVAGDPERDSQCICFEWNVETRDLNVEDPKFSLGDSILERQGPTEYRPRWDLKLIMRPPSGMTPGVLELIGDSARFSLPRLRSLISAYCALLEEVIANPMAAPADIVMAERYDRAASSPIVPCRVASALDEPQVDMATLFATIASRHAGATAVAWRNGEMTFGELRDSANDLQRLLRIRGAEHGDIIGFRLRPDANSIDRALFLVTQIAAFQLGCVLLPLGQQAPPAQAREQIEALGARFLIAFSADMDCAPAGASDSAKDDPAPGFPGARLRCLNIRRRPKNDAPDGDTALLFTSSGTTGRPKTIRVSQAMILSLLRGLDRAAVFLPVPGLMGANIGFDTILTDIWLPWIYGRHLVILDTERRTPSALATARALGARTCSLSPTRATAALNDDVSCFTGFDLLVLTGEALPAQLIRRLREAAPDLALVNAYGPTETAVWATLCTVDEARESHVSIGRAVPGYRVLIAGPDLKPAPAHWPGEILIASAAPALGYRDAELTKARFIELPGEESGPFFRTGDFGWIDEMGRVQFIGRRDRQIKLNGVRIEVDGIEHRIAEVEGVADVGVLIETHEARVMQIVAMIQQNAGGDPAKLTARIMEHCQIWLPRAAIPSRLVFVDSMPMGASGKKAYAELTRVLADARRQPAASNLTLRTLPAAGSIEGEIASMWHALLEGAIDPTVYISLEDDVFALGATSLDALRMAERLERRFGIRFPDHQIFVRRTIEEQAALVRSMVSRPAIQAGKPRPGAVEIHLIRTASGASRGVVIGLPGMSGESAYLGAFAAEALLDYEFWTCTADFGGRLMKQDGMWIEFLEAVAARLIREDVRPRALIGFSWGGYLAWVLDRLLVAGGLPATPIINLDGDPLHIPWREFQKPIESLRAKTANASPSRMLLLQRASIADIVMPVPLEMQWMTEGVHLQTIHCRTVNHRDFAYPNMFPAQNAAMTAFIESGTVFTVVQAGAVDIDTAGGAIFRLLERNTKPSVDAVQTIIDMLPPRPVDRETVRPGLLFLAIATGDSNLALNFADRLILEDSTYRGAIHAKVAILSQIGKRRKASKVVSAWLRDHPQDVALKERTAFTMPRAVDLSGAESIFSNGEETAFDTAAGFLPERATKMPLLVTRRFMALVSRSYPTGRLGAFPFRRRRNPRLNPRTGDASSAPLSGE